MAVVHQVAFETVLENVGKWKCSNFWNSVIRSYSVPNLRKLPPRLLLWFMRCTKTLLGHEEEFVSDFKCWQRKGWRWWTCCTTLNKLNCRKSGRNTWSHELLKCATVKNLNWRKTIVQEMVTGDLNMKKRCAKLLPKLLTDDQKTRPVIVSTRNG